MRAVLRAWWLVIAIGVATLACGIAMPPGAFSGDEGIKLAQTQGILEGQIAMAYAGREMDPAQTLHGFAQPTFSFRRGNAVYGTYPWPMPAISAPFYWLAGFRGLVALPLVSLIVILVLSARFANALWHQAWATQLVVAILALATPLALYATVFWEHVPASAAVLGSLALLVMPDREATLPRALGAGALFALSACFRTELYAFAPGMALVILWRHPPREWRFWIAFVVGAAAVTGLYLLSNRILLGVWHPTLLAASDGERPTFRTRSEHLFDGRWYPMAYWLIGAALLVGLLRMVAARWPGDAPWRGKLAAIDPLTIAISLAIGWFAVRAIAFVDGDRVRTLTGLVGASAFLLFALARPLSLRRGSPIGILTVAALAYALAILLFPQKSATAGLQLGGRYLLPIVPLLVLAIVDFCRARLSRMICLVALLGLAAWGTVINVIAEYRIRRIATELHEVVAATGVHDVFSQTFWIPQLLAPLQPDVRIYYGAPPSDIYDRLTEHGVTKVLSLGGTPPPPTGRVRLQREPGKLPRGGAVFDLVPN